MTMAAAQTVWGLFFTASELAEIPQPLTESLLSTRWRPDLDLCTFAAAGSVLHATPMFAANGQRLPRFISCILPFR